MKIKTVMIDNNGTSLVINASDFRRGSDKLWGEKDQVKAKVKAKVEDKAEALRDNVKVKHKGGGRWNVIVNDEQINDEPMSKEDAQALADEY